MLFLASQEQAGSVEVSASLAGPDLNPAQVSTSKCVLCSLGGGWEMEGAF